MLKKLLDAVEYYTKLWGKEMVETVESGVNFSFPDLGTTVTIKNGGNNSEISSEIFDELSLDEIKKAAKISEKSLKDIGKETLIAKDKKITGAKANSVMYKSLI